MECGVIILRMVFITLHKNRIIFDGIFKDDKRNGYGKEFNEYDEIINEGIWKDNKFLKRVSDDELCIVCILRIKRKLHFTLWTFLYLSRMF